MFIGIYLERNMGTVVETVKHNGHYSLMILRNEGEGNPCSQWHIKALSLWHSSFGE